MKYDAFPQDLELMRSGATRRRRIVLAAVAAIAIVALALTWALLRWSGSAPAAPVEKPPADGTFQATPAQLASFRIETVATLSFRSAQATEGKIAVNLDHSTPVFSPFSGRVTKVLAALGSRVKQGEPLLAVDASEFVQGQNDLVAAASALNTARAQLGQAEINEQRKHALYDAKAGALQDWQQSQADLASARNNFRSAETQLNLVRNRLRILGKTDAEISGFERAERIAPTAFVVAPIGGTVIDRQVGLGQYIQAGASNPVYVIGDLANVWLIANVRETDTPLMRVGDPVEVRVLAFPGEVFKAKISYVGPMVDPATRRVAVRAEVENPRGALKPEMFASFSIITGAPSAAPAVPQGAVVYEGDEARVWVVQPGGRIGLRKVRTGRAEGDMVEITSGLEPGEQVVTSGTLFIDRAAKRATE